MNKFVFTLASTLALGVAGSGFALAAEPANTTPMPTNNSSALSTQTPATQTPTMMQQSEQTQAAPAKLSASQIRQVQEQLKTAGIYKGKADGRMGTRTRQAVQQFQQQNGLQSTGQLDQQTVAALQNNQVNTGSTASPNASPPPAAGESNNNLNNNQRHY